MAATAYVSLSDVKAHPAALELDSVDTWDAIIPDLALRASVMIDMLTRREPGAYDASATASARKYDSEGGEELAIDECTSVTTVKCRRGSGTGWTTLASTDYRTWPYNASARSEPIRRLDIDDRQGSYSEWPDTGRESVEVTAKWGYSDDPPDVVKQAVIIQVLRWLKRGEMMYADASLGGAVFGSLTYATEIDPDIKTLIFTSGLMRKDELF